MAQVASQPIIVGTRAVGKVSVDSGVIAGEGGPLRPQLVIPLRVEVDPMPEGSTLAVLAVRARLDVADPPRAETLIGSPVTESLLGGFYARSLPRGTNSHDVSLRFFLTAMDVELIERYRHATAESNFQLHLDVGADVAGLQIHNEFGSGQAPADTPWSATHYGMFAQVLPFWDARVGRLAVSVETSKWVRDVLPGLGYDRLRLIEMQFPPPLPDHPNAAKEWDKARKAFDEARYGDCVAECRDLLSMWAKILGANRQRPVGTIIADNRRWASDDRRRGFLDSLWKSAIDVVNVEHHPEGAPGGQKFSPEDARLVLLLVSALLEYLPAGS